MRFILDAHRFLLSFSFREVNWRSPKTWGVIVGVALVLFALVRSFSGGVTSEEDVKRMREVTLATVGALTSDTMPLSIIGEVQSATEADLRAESGGRVTGVYAKLGDFAAAGAIIAETENSAQRAAVLQAEGTLDAAKAGLAKIRGGTRDEQLAIMRSSFVSAQGGAVTTLLSAYGSVDSAVNDTADKMFSGIALKQPNFMILTSNQQVELDLEQRRSALDTVLTRELSVSRTLSSTSDLKSELSLTETELRETRTFVDILIRALNDAIPSESSSEATITAYKAEATASRATLTASLSAIVGTKNALEVAEKNWEQGSTGAESEDVAQVEASVKQAQGIYNAALSALEKTRIRTPISGTVNNLSVSRGDFVSPQAQIAVISNNSALEIVAYVTEEDRGNIRPGADVVIEGSTKGTITRVAPALDPITRKIEVRIGIPQKSSLSNGQSVRIDIHRTQTKTVTSVEPFSIPISAVKIEAQRTVVFTTTASKLTAHEIELGPLLGDKIIILSGLNADMEIVVDARGLKEGQEVVLKEKLDVRN